MDFVIVGGGAVGLVFANYLAQLGHAVELLVHSEKQRLSIQNEGVTFTNCYGEKSVQKFVVSTNPSDLHQRAIWIIAVKYHHLNELLPLFEQLSEDTELLFIQNGIRHIEFAKKLKQHTIYMGSVEFGAEKINDHNVIHRGIGTLNIAIFRGLQSNLQKYSSLSSTVFPVALIEDYNNMLLRKALLNCFVNTLTTILRVKNGALIEHSYNKKILQQLYQEVMNAFPEQTTQLSFEDVANVCKNTAQNSSSMFADYLNGRIMEIDTIIGGIIEIAHERGYVVPMLSTCYSLLQAMQESGVRD
ncbi:ketopantoate reductase family protein [Rummeliibacillus pycnus]|uniref:ketopantoate reductase family protein n=1 Tax=Rummeliibacillus pycnus TaxID=101070 RepID=UPI000C9CB319|nr:2-dehydropantoate 2-reductase [Rummeliibacillus pycnus]